MVVLPVKVTGNHVIEVILIAKPKNFSIFTSHDSARSDLPVRKKNTPNIITSCKLNI